MARLWGILTVIFLVTGAHAASIKLTPENPRQGEIARIHVSGAGTFGKGGLNVRFLDRTFPLSASGKDTFTGFIAVDRDAKPGRHALSLVGGDGARGEEFKVKVAGRKFEEQHLKVDKKTVELSPEDQERAARERELINAALSKVTGSRDWEAGFSRPLAGEVSSTFGLKRFYNGKAASYHGGLDIAAGEGEPVKASSSGRAALAGDFFYTGNTLFIDHGMGLFTAYFHMRETKASQGERIKGGDVIGLVGSTGRSTGPHLHWSVYLCGVKVDPESLLKINAANLARGETP